MQETKRFSLCLASLLVNNAKNQRGSVALRLKIAHVEQLMGKLFDKITNDFFNVPNFFIGSDGNYRNATVKKEFGKYKVGDPLKLRFDFVDEKVYIDGKEIFFIPKCTFT